MTTQQAKMLGFKYDKGDKSWYHDDGWYYDSKALKKLLIKEHIQYIEQVAYELGIKEAKIKIQEALGIAVSINK